MNEEAQPPLREQGISLVHSSHRDATPGHLFFFSLVIRYVWDF